MKTVLFIGEDPGEQDIFDAAFSVLRFKIDCHLRSSLSDALEWLNKNRPDIIFINADFPVVDGLHSLRSIRKIPLHYTTCLVFFSETLDEETKEAAGKAGATLSFIKPESRSEFLLLFEFIIGFANVRLT